MWTPARLNVSFTQKKLKNSANHYYTSFVFIVFSTNFSYIVQRELDLLRHPELSIRTLATDGAFGFGQSKNKWSSQGDDTLPLGCDLVTSSFSKSAACEFIVPIKIIFKVQDATIRDDFEWDFANPDNSVQEFVGHYIRDIVLEKGFLIGETEITRLEKEVQSQIYRQLDEACYRAALRTKHTLERVAAAVIPEDQVEENYEEKMDLLEGVISKPKEKSKKIHNHAGYPPDEVSFYPNPLLASLPSSKITRQI